MNGASENGGRQRTCTNGFSEAKQVVKNSSDRNKTNEKIPFDERYELLNRIGRGSYAKVFKAIRREDGQIFAIKKVRVTSESTYLINEIKIMKECKHINIARYLESDCSEMEVSIVMEYCRGGSVKDVMKNLNCTLNYRQILVILRDVLRGLEYLHSKGSIHRDVKAANILLHEDGLAKLGDFGVSEPSDTSTTKQSIIGTLLWLPPEVISRSIDPNHSSVIDIWSLGITIIEMADGKPPYSDLAVEAAQREIADLTEPSPKFQEPYQCPELENFLNLCLKKQASERRGAKELLEHQIFTVHEPSPEEISSLVEKVCFSPARSAELESDLRRETESLMIENCQLFAVYKERPRKVVIVDKFTESLRSLEDSFKNMKAVIEGKNDEISRYSSELDSLQAKIAELSGQRDVLTSKLSDNRDRIEKKMVEIHKIEKGRDRLRSLESSKAG